MEENSINVKLTFQDSTGPCYIPKYSVAPKSNSSQSVLLSCFPLTRIDVIMGWMGGGCSFTSPSPQGLVFEVNSKMDGSSCEIVPVEGWL